MQTSRRRTLAACAGAHAVQDGLGATLFVLLPIVAQALGLSYAQVGLVRAVNHTAMMLFELPGGFLAERVGEQRLLVFGLLAAGLGFFALSSADTFLAVLVALGLAGFGAAFQHALSSSLISVAYEGPRQRTALGAYNSFGDVGKLAYTTAFSFAAGMGLAWQTIVLGYGITAWIAALGVYLALRHRVRPGPKADDSTSDAGTGERGVRQWGFRHWGIHDRRAFLTLTVVVSLDICVQGGFLTFLAFLMIEKEVPTGLATLAVVLTLAGGVFGKFGCGVLAERLGIVRSLVVVQCATAALILVVLWAPTLVAYCLLPVLGVVLQGSSSITYGTVADLVDDERRARTFAWIYSVSGAAGVIGPILFGFVGDRWGLAPAMWTMAAMVLLTVPLALALRPALASSTTSAAPSSLESG